MLHRALRGGLWSTKRPSCQGGELPRVHQTNCVVSTWIPTCLHPETVTMFNWSVPGQSVSLTTVHDIVPVQSWHCASNLTHTKLPVGSTVHVDLHVHLNQGPMTVDTTDSKKSNYSWHRSQAYPGLWIYYHLGNPLQSKKRYKFRKCLIMNLLRTNKWARITAIFIA